MLRDTEVEHDVEKGLLCKEHLNIYLIKTIPRDRTSEIHTETMETNAQKHVHIPVLRVNIICGTVRTEIKFELGCLPAYLLYSQSCEWLLVLVPVIMNLSDNVQWKNCSRPVQQKAEGD